MSLLLGCILAWCCRASARPSHYSPLGPGPLEWTLTEPEVVGLSAEHLAAAGERAGHVGVPLCLSIVKNGALVLDRSYGGSPFMRTSDGMRRVEAASAAKTVTAALIGAAVQKGLFDIDVPLVKYGVQPMANWNQTGLDFFPKVRDSPFAPQAPLPCDNMRPMHVGR